MWTELSAALITRHDKVLQQQRRQVLQNSPAGFVASANSEQLMTTILPPTLSLPSTSEHREPPPYPPPAPIILIRHYHHHQTRQILSVNISEPKVNQEAQAERLLSLTAVASQRRPHKELFNDGLNHLTLSVQHIFIYVRPQMQQ
ncbi:hypothetical protein JOB18_023186 [Solea senegalensis]|uniref:Uncharacterized protein n=1 Tax=Solea senegalensis TaxID=28829 RepID=A0AAV6PCI5_SOLSE|nr:hypothetical protein JOB18_023186 [Solea senegalensis]